MKHLVTWIALAAAAHAGVAQSVDDATAAFAISNTSVGALTPLVTPAMSQRRLNGGQLGLRYGLRTEGDVHTAGYAATGIFAPNLQSSVTLTAGVLTADCTGCDPSLMLGAGGDMRVYEGGDQSGGGSSLTIAVSGDVGYTRLRPESLNLLAIGIGAPVTLSFPTGGREGLHVSPYFTPMFGIGRVSGSCAVATSCEGNGTRFLLGGGVGVWNPSSNFSASLGVNRVMISGGESVFGINVVIGGR